MALKSFSEINIDLLDKYVRPGGVTVEKHPDADIYIYGYQTATHGVQNIVWDNYNIFCRGLIIDSNNNVLAAPFPKFFTFRKHLNEKYILLSDGQTRPLPKNLPYKIYDKLDGSLSILYWLNDTPYLASQRSFTSYKAKKATSILHNKYSHLFNKLDKSKTYLFEAIYPESKVIVDYGNEEKLVLIGIMDTKTCQDLPLENIGFPLAEDLTEQYEGFKTLDDLQNIYGQNKEGVVIVYKNGFRIKVKFDWFRKSHRILNQIIRLNGMIFDLENELKFQMNKHSIFLNNHNIWEELKSRGNTLNIKIRLRDYHYNLGAEMWIEEYENELLNKFNIHKKNNPTLEDNEIWNLIEPVDKEEFIPKEKINLASSEMIMWNRDKRLSEKFS